MNTYKMNIGHTNIPTQRSRNKTPNPMKTEANNDTRSSL